MPIIPATWELRQENCLSPGGGGCSELRLYHCTPTWAIRAKTLSQKEKKNKTWLGTVVHAYNFGTLRSQGGRSACVQQFETSLGNAVRQYHKETNKKCYLVWWCIPVVPATQKADVGGSLEPGKLRLK